MTSGRISAARAFMAVYREAWNDSLMMQPRT